MATPVEIENFLKDASLRAFKQAVFAVKNDETAMDLVQDSMLKLAEKYSDKPAEELPMLFSRILQNTILDHHRRQKVRRTWVSFFSSFQKDGQDEYDVMESLLSSEENSNPSSEGELTQKQTMAQIEEAISRLPERQRQAFLLRYWEEMDLSETAAVMGCSEGSVKTHCSRATKALAQVLNEMGLSLNE